MDKQERRMQGNVKRSRLESGFHFVNLRFVHDDREWLRIEKLTFLPVAGMVFVGSNVELHVESVCYLFDEAIWDVSCKCNGLISDEDLELRWEPQ